MLAWRPGDGRRTRRFASTPPVERRAQCTLSRMSAITLPNADLHPIPRRTPLLVYRDRIGAPSEIQFLRRQYVGFTRLAPVWVGRHIMPQAPALGGSIALARRQRSGRLAAHARCSAISAVRRPCPLAHIAPVLHAQFARGGALALPLAQALGLRLVVTLHGGDVSKAKNWRGTVQARRWPAVVAAASRFVCVSAAVADAALGARRATRQARGAADRRRGARSAATRRPGRPATCSSAASCPRRASACWPMPSAACALQATPPRWSASATARNAPRWRPLPATPAA